MIESSLDVAKVSKHPGTKFTAVILLFPAIKLKTSAFLSLISQILADKSLLPVKNMLLSMELTSTHATSLVCPLSIAMCLWGLAISQTPTKESVEPEIK